MKRAKIVPFLEDYEAHFEVEHTDSKLKKLYIWIAFSCVNFGKHSSIGGLSHTTTPYFSTNFCARIMWLIWSLVCTGSLFYFLMIRFEKLLANEKTTSISKESALNLTLPKITICNTNSYDESDPYQLLARSLRFLPKFHYILA